MTIYLDESSIYTTTVQSLWEKLVPRLDLGRYSVSFLDSCQEIIELISDHLWFRKSDLLITEYTYLLPQGSSVINLPPEFMALQYYPYLHDIQTTETIILSNIHESRTHDYLGQDRTKYYELMSTGLNIYPPTNKEYEFFVRAYAKPTPLASMSDTLPFNGLFNLLIGDYAVKVSNVGLDILSDPAFVTSLNEKVDKLINLRNTKNIYWKQTRTSRQYLYNNINPDYF